MSADLHVAMHAASARCRFPWWWHTRLAFLLWLQLPTFQVGARLRV